MAQFVLHELWPALSQLFWLHGFMIAILDVGHELPTELHPHHKMNQECVGINQYSVLQQFHTIESSHWFTSILNPLPSIFRLRESIK
jgi:hypothetical protein